MWVAAYQTLRYTCAYCTLGFHWGLPLHSTAWNWKINQCIGRCNAPAVVHSTCKSNFLKSSLHVKEGIVGPVHRPSYPCVLVHNIIQLLSIILFLVRFTWISHNLSGWICLDKHPPGMILTPHTTYSWSHLTWSLARITSCVFYRTEYTHSGQCNILHMFMCRCIRQHGMDWYRCIMYTTQNGPLRVHYAGYAFQM